MQTDISGVVDTLDFYGTILFISLVSFLLPSYRLTSLEIPKYCFFQHELQINILTVSQQSGHLSMGPVARHLNHRFGF